MVPDTDYLWNQRAEWSLLRLPSIVDIFYIPGNAPQATRDSITIA